MKLPSLERCYIESNADTYESYSESTNSNDYCRNSNCDFGIIHQESLHIVRTLNPC